MDIRGDDIARCGSLVGVQHSRAIIEKNVLGNIVLDKLVHAQIMVGSSVPINSQLFGKFLRSKPYRDTLLPGKRVISKLTDACMEDHGFQICTALHGVASHTRHRQVVNTFRENILLSIAIVTAQEKSTLGSKNKGTVIFKDHAVSIQTIRGSASPTVDKGCG